ncbi:unnamed protein product [Bursaphelenchus okinawaensis]|uniref:Uncharacterized protein n=1 Tax=Bursaphelenchus okinawaensis TaxID=465554 RepID=A0A811LSY4_9BILA|nr:unnamed protein product [Bursaphelenchus okinawaensis]CAG9127973.1 unnamed protein product [Bursaphelenchus okinawaensis]
MNLVNVGFLIKHRLKGYISGKLEVNLVICSAIVFVVQTGLGIGQYIFESGLVDIFITLRFIVPPTVHMQFLLPALIIVCSIGPLRQAAFKPFQRMPSDMFRTFASSTSTPVEHIDKMMSPSSTK